MSCPVMLPCNWKAWQLHYPWHGYQHCKETALMTCYTVSVKTFSCSLLPLTYSFPMIGGNSKQIWIIAEGGTYYLRRVISRPTIFPSLSINSTRWVSQMYNL